MSRLINVCIQLIAFHILILQLAGCSLIAPPSEEEIESAWLSSAHSDIASRSFTNWDNRDPKQIPANCAKCHSTTGYHDFLGLDGSNPGTVDSPAATGTTVECEACHNEISNRKHAAIMPSGAELVRLGDNADCMECHQGRSSTNHVDEAIGGMDADTVNRELSFVNIHNNAAAPTLYGSDAMGGYEYANREYLGRYGHAPEFTDCTDCHDPHSLRVRTKQCSACHPAVRSTAHLRTIRTHKTDFDGDGNTEEGMRGEIETMQERLLTAITAYAALTKGLDRIQYESRNPYFFKADTGDSYTTWTPRLLKATYNYQYALKGKGGYAHNPLYTLQLLYDSLEDLGVPMSGMTRPER